MLLLFLQKSSLLYLPVPPLEGGGTPLNILFFVAAIPPSVFPINKITLNSIRYDNTYFKFVGF